MPGLRSLEIVPLDDVGFCHACHRLAPLEMLCGVHENDDGTTTTSKHAVVVEHGCDLVAAPAVLVFGAGWISWQLRNLEPTECA